MDDPRPTVVAVINTSPDTVDLLRFVFEHAGFTVVTAFTWELRDSKVDVETFMRQHSPHVVVYDIAPPYEENWHLFQHFCTTPAFRGRKFVVTTTNAKQVHAVAGDAVTLYEIIGKPYDLDQVVKAVKDALEDASARSAATSGSSRPS